MCVCSNEGDGVKDGVGVLQTKALLGAQKWVTACWPTMAQLCGWGATIAQWINSALINLSLMNLSALILYYIVCKYKEK